MRGEPGFFDIDERLKELSAKGDDLERLNAIVDFEMFRADLERAAPRSDRAKERPFADGFMEGSRCESAWGPNADQRRTLLINLALAGSISDAYSHHSVELWERALVEGFELVRGDVEYAGGRVGNFNRIDELGQLAPRQFGEVGP
jgi:hypothetical protein